MAMLLKVRRQMLTPVHQWTSLEAGKWVAALGFPQYRKRFIHQGIKGELLLELTGSHLKVSILLTHMSPNPSAHVS